MVDMPCINDWWWKLKGFVKLWNTHVKIEQFNKARLPVPEKRVADKSIENEKKINEKKLKNFEQKF